MTSSQGRMRPTGSRSREIVELLDEYSGVVSLAATTAPALAEAHISGIAVGSADVLPGDLFVALTGLRSHGATYVAQALEAGAAAILTDASGIDLLAAHADLLAAMPVLVFADSTTERKTLGAISAWFYDHPARAMTTVGITGTNGKTTTTYFIDAALAQGHETTALVGTVELRVGTESIHSPRTTVEAPVLQGILALARERGASALTMEVSSHALALERTAGMEFDVVAFTNLQRDHLDFHGTMEGYFADKSRLFDAASAREGVACVDDEWGVRLAAESRIPVQTVATREGAVGRDTADWVVSDAAIGHDQVGSTFTLTGPEGVAVRVHCPLPGLVNVSNAALAVVVAHRTGVSLENAARGVEQVAGIPGRMERVLERDATGPLVIVDYAHTPDALTLALEGVRPITPGRLAIVLGSDGDRDQGKRPLMGEIAARYADDVVITDENPRSEVPAAIRAQILEGVRAIRPELEDVREISPRWDAVAAAVHAAGPEDTVIITGKGHEPFQEIAGVFHPYNDRDAVLATREQSRPD